MPQSPMRLIRNATEFVAQEQIDEIEKFARGIYVLYRHRPKLDNYDVLYVGMSTRGVKYRLREHLKKKGDLWTHFSVFQAWDNVRDEEIQELEGLFRHLYRKDSRANSLNIQKSYKPLNKIRTKRLTDWE